MKVLLVLLINVTLCLNATAQKMKDYTIQIGINAPKEIVWKAITDFEAFPEWNSVLAMENNDSLVIGNEFNVTITQPNDKKSGFKATALSKEKFRSFSARQKILGKWFFQATHHFIIEETDQQTVTFTQKWELTGLISSLFRKQIFKELEVFKTMNTELKVLVET